LQAALNERRMVRWSTEALRSVMKSYTGSPQLLIAFC